MCWCYFLYQVHGTLTDTFGREPHLCLSLEPRLQLHKYPRFSNYTHLCLRFAHECIQISDWLINLIVWTNPIFCRGQFWFHFAVEIWFCLGTPKCTILRRAFWVPIPPCRQELPWGKSIIRVRRGDVREQFSWFFFAFWCRPRFQDWSCQNILDLYSCK